MFPIQEQGCTEKNVRHFCPDTCYNKVKKKQHFNTEVKYRYPRLGHNYSCGKRLKKSVKQKSEHYLCSIFIQPFPKFLFKYSD